VTGGRWICGAAIALHAAWPLPAAAQPPLTVFAASSLTQALETLGPAFAAQTGVPVRFSFAATSTLARQIEAGAGADVFVSADEQWMNYLETRRLTVKITSTAILSNRLVLVVPADSRATVTLAPGFDLPALLGRGRLAVGDPAHVPAGRYAREALTALGVWTAAEGRLAPGESVRAALALVERGEVPAGIVYESDAALSSRVRVAGVFPVSSHSRIVYTAAVVAGRDTPAARQFVAFLRSPAARAVFTAHRFIVP